MSSQHTVGFVGKPFKDFIQWLHEHSFEVDLYFDKNESYSSTPYISHMYPIDFSSASSMAKDLEKVSQKPLFLVNTYENGVPLKEKLTTYFQLPGISPEAARLSTDKFLMRSAFLKHCPEFTPHFTLAEQWSDVEQFLSLTDIHFPLILKPTNLFKSLLVTKNDSKEELKKNFDEGRALIESIYQKEGVHFAPRFVVEEFLDGPSYSLEVFTDNNGTMVAAPSAVDLVMGRDIGINDNYNYSRKLPSQLSSAQQEKVREAAFAGVQAIGLTSSPAHVEIVYTASGPKLIEIGARTGGYRPRMHLLAQGVDLFQAQIDVAQGNLPHLQSSKNDWCAVYEIFSEKEGAFTEISHLNEISKLPTLYYMNARISPGEVTGPAKKGYRAAMIIIFLSNDAEQFKKDTTYFEHNAHVVVRSN